MFPRKKGDLLLKIVCKHFEINYFGDNKIKKPVERENDFDLFR